MNVIPLHMLSPLRVHEDHPVVVTAQITQEHPARVRAGLLHGDHAHTKRIVELTAACVLCGVELSCEDLVWTT